jgi:phosphatidylinositol alpha-1,6-mannosyltransferase
MFGPDQPRPATVVRTIIQNLNRSILPLLKLRPPPLPVKWFVYDLYCFSLLLKADLIRREHDVVYAHWLFPAGMVALLSSKVRRSRVISSVWGYDIQVVPGIPEYGARGHVAALSRFVLLKSDAVIVNHQVHGLIASKLAGLSEGRFYYLNPGIDDMEASPYSISSNGQISALITAAARKKVVLFVASSLERMYGIVEFMQALPIVAKECRNCMFIIVGDGPMKQLASQMAQRSGLGDHIIFTGRIAHEQMPSLYRLATVVCDMAYPGQGTVSLEAASMGRPVIGILSSKRYVVDGETGYLVRKGDHLGLAKSLLRILEDETNSARLGSKARTLFLKTSTIENRVSALLRIFKEIADGDERKVG